MAYPRAVNAIDGVVVEGPKAGVHLGFKEEDIENPDFIIEKLIPEVVKEVKEFEEQFAREIPVIAAGGIFDGKDIYKFLNLGARGVIKCFLIPLCA